MADLTPDEIQAKIDDLAHYLWAVEAALEADEPDLEFIWFIPRKKEIKKTKTGKEYWVIEVVDSTGKLTKIRCWGIQPTDSIQMNRPYISRLDYNDQFGFSTRSVRKSFRMIG